MINVRFQGSESDARAIAMSKNRDKPVHIRGVFWVRDAEGRETGERDFVFATTLSGGSSEEN